ncbi:MAG: aldehyde dehydrogenase family protein [Spirochaetota bacterium]
MSNQTSPDTLYNPANGQAIGTILRQSPEDAARAVAAARRAQTKWESLPFSGKNHIFKQVSALIGERSTQLTKTIAACTGKTRIDALSTEVLPAAIAARYYPKAARKFMRPRRVQRSSILFFNKHSRLYRKPHGVVGIISPWNYPFGIPFHEICQALTTGNAVVFKVATQTQPVGEAIAALFYDAGLPRDLLHVLHLSGREAGEGLLAAGIDKLFFTGSVPVGKQLMAAASAYLTPVSLELGGNDAMIVLEDANLRRAAAGAAWAGLSNCGQSCGGVERIYVIDSVYDQFTSLLKEEISALRQGDDTSAPFSHPVHYDLGALTTASQMETVQNHAEDAARKGARFSAQTNTPPAEKPNESKGLFHSAILLESVNHDMKVMREETFGPLLAVHKVSSPSEAIEKANDSDLGLTGSVWSRNRRLADSVAARFQAGAITINDHLMSHGMPETPWGGYKNSAIGRSHGTPGFEEMTQPKVVIHDSLGNVNRNIWWYPHSSEVLHGLHGALSLLTARGLRKKLSGARHLIPLYFKRLFGK